MRRQLDCAAGFKLRGSLSIRITTSAIVLAVAASVSAPAVAQTSGDIANPISRAIQQGWDSAKQDVLKSAEQMLEADYNFRPIDTVRTFGQIIAHVAGNNYVVCAVAKGEKSPFTQQHFEQTAKTKAEIVKALSDSIAYCDEAYNSLTDAKAAEIVQVFRNKAARAAPFLINSAHVEQHYGNLITYMRIKGMVPPSSAPRQ